MAYKRIYIRTITRPDPTNPAFDPAFPPAILAESTRLIAAGILVSKTKKEYPLTEAPTVSKETTTDIWRSLEDMQAFDEWINTNHLAAYNAWSSARSIVENTTYSGEI